MKTIKYLVDYRFRRAGQVRMEEDGVAEQMIRRGFAEETDAEPDAAGGDGRAIAQYHPDGSEPPDAPRPDETGLESEPAALNAPGALGANADQAQEQHEANEHESDAAVTDGQGLDKKAAPLK